MLNSDQGTTTGALAVRPSSADLAVITVSTNEAHWLRRALPSVFEHAGDAKLDVVVVDNSSTDGTREIAGVGVSGGARHNLGESRVRSREQLRRHRVRRPLRPVPKPRYRNSRRHLRPSFSRRWSASRRSGWQA